MPLKLILSLVRLPIPPLQRDSCDAANSTAYHSLPSLPIPNSAALGRIFLSPGMALTFHCTQPVTPRFQWEKEWIASYSSRDRARVRKRHNVFWGGVSERTFSYSALTVSNTLRQE